EKIGLQRQTIPVPTGHLQNRLESLADEQDGSSHRAQTHDRALIIRHVDSVHFVFQKRRSGYKLRQVCALRRLRLGGDYKLTGVEPFVYMIHMNSDLPSSE